MTRVNLSLTIPQAKALWASSTDEALEGGHWAGSLDDYWQAFGELESAISDAEEGQ